MWIPTTIVPSICPTLCLTLPPSPASMGSPPVQPALLAPLQLPCPHPALDGPHQLCPSPSGLCPTPQVLLLRHRGRASTALVKGFARAVGGSAEFITGQDHVQPKVPQSLKWALQLAVTGISLSWDLPPGIQAEGCTGTPR
ncbi:unnamed protein product [Lepidochelys kempii]